ncbi:MAG: ABC transporter ATP-binding protein [Chloracidobacterium sp.]|nr:ABC transporter ATP-binding protein [Chloracidobacterium sp.]MDW8218176.1 ABC transporter ATP-binding protein [Acidobacteriota bacterium]
MTKLSAPVAVAPSAPPSVAPAVSLQHVNKSFGVGNTYLPVLKDINLEIRRGELLLLVGPSGCGKTTLLSVMAGILDADDGVVNVFGTRVDRLSQSKKTRFRQENIGFIFQQFNLIPTLTATENVAVPLIIAGRPYREALEQARHYLSLVGLGDRLEHFPTQLSGGQQQRVAIARALVAEPRLVVCDEPTAALDGATGKVVMEMFRQVALSSERAIVVVTHDNRIFPYGDRIAEMLDGRIVDVHDNPDHVR